MLLCKYYFCSSASVSLDNSMNQCWTRPEKMLRHQESYRNYKRKSKTKHEYNSFVDLLADFDLMETLTALSRVWF